jgi:hypothetical protein
MNGKHIFEVFGAASGDVQSDIFTVLPGWEATALGFGFRRELVKVNPDGYKTIQAACLYQVLLSGTEFMAREEGCGVVAVIPPRVNDILAEGPVAIDGCFVSVDACNSRVALPTPGTYRFILNDPEAVGNVQVYVTAFPKNMLGTYGK